MSVEKVRVREIMTNVARDETFLTDAIHREFWSLADKTGAKSTEDLERASNIIIKLGLTYQRYFWEDALWALKSGRFYKSRQRAPFETDNKFMFHESRLRQSDLMIEDISQKVPIVVGAGEKKVFDEDAIVETLNRVQTSGSRIKQLLAKPR